MEVTALRSLPVVLVAAEQATAGLPASCGERKVRENCTPILGTCFHCLLSTGMGELYTYLVRFQ